MKGKAGIVFIVALGGIAWPSGYRAALGSPSTDAEAVMGAYRSIWVDKSRQRLYAFEGNRLVMEASCSTAAHHPHYAPGEDRYLKPATPLGNYRIFEKTPDHFSHTYEVHMRYALFYDGGRAIHATYPSEYRYLGSPASGGCVRLKRSHAIALFQWAHVGDAVHVVRELPGAVMALLQRTSPDRTLVAERPRPRRVIVLRDTGRKPVLLSRSFAAQMIYDPIYNHQVVHAVSQQAMEPSSPSASTAPKTTPSGDVNVDGDNSAPGQDPSTPASEVRAAP